MERSEHAAIKIEVTAPQSICARAASPAANAWWLFGALSPESAKVSPLTKVFCEDGSLVPGGTGLELMQFNNPASTKNKIWTTLRLIKSIGRSLLRHGFFLLSLAVVLVCFGFSPNAPGATFAPTEEERVGATEQGFSGELKLAVLPRKIDPEGRTYVEVDDMLFWVREGAGIESAFTGNRWTNGIVYYVFDAAVSSTNRQNWRNAAAAWSAVAPLSFTEGTGIGNYIYVQNGSGNNSYVGMIGGSQVMNIFNWTSVYTIAHEIGHALGLIHEHQRSGRDSYVTINYSYVQSGYEGNFYIAASTNYGGYDFDSVMHYNKCIFSTDCSPSFICACTHYTITVRPPNTQWQDLIGQLTHLSHLDGTGMAQRYSVPVVTTNPATYVASFSTTLNGSVDPQGLTTTVYFQYGTTTSYGLTTAMRTQTGNTFQNIAANISSLSANTIYHFRIVATNSAGTTLWQRQNAHHA